MSTQEHEAAAETLAKKLWPPRPVGWEQAIQLIAAALADAERVAREEDCKAVCQFCREGSPIPRPIYTDKADPVRWWHDVKSLTYGTYEEACAAAGIWSYLRANAGQCRHALTFKGTGACIDCGQAGEGDATPGPEPDPALMDALRGSLRWATPPKKGRD